MVFRLWRAPAGIRVELTETGVRRGSAVGTEGYHFSVLGRHDGQVEDLIAWVVAIAEQEVATTHLEPAKFRDGWTVGEGDEVAGRLVFNPDGGPYHVVVDGRELTWEQLGEALEPFEGWRFRLLIEEPSEDVRPDADVLPLPNPNGTAPPTEGDAQPDG